ncbi:uncharacterized protein [Epargyreus clarus]
MEWARCGDSSLSMVPTAVWAVGSAALAHRMLTALFRRFIFRRVPLWELILQHLLFLWMVIYSIHFWVVLVSIVKVFVEYCYEIDENSVTTNEDIQSQKIMQQWIIWMFGAIPLSVYIQTRPRPIAPPLMIWITTSPWQRREMGPYGYYLNRPFPELESASETVRNQALTLRRAFSDSKTMIKEPRKKRRNSKSV